MVFRVRGVGTSHHGGGRRGAVTTDRTQSPRAADGAAVLSTHRVPYCYIISYLCTNGNRTLSNIADLRVYCVDSMCLPWHEFVCVCNQLHQILSYFCLQKLTIAVVSCFGTHTCCERKLNFRYLLARVVAKIKKCPVNSSQCWWKTFEMDDSWESNVSHLMMGVGMSDSREIVSIQPSCSSQDMPQDPHHHMQQQRPDISRDLGQNQELHSNQNSLEHEYFSSAVSICIIRSFIGYMMCFKVKGSLK